MTLTLTDRNGSKPVPTTDQETPATDITERAVSLAVRVRRFGNVRKLSTEAVEVDADKAMLGAHKKLVDSPELKAVAKLDSQILEFVYSRSLPSLFKQGVYLVPIALVEELDARLEAFGTQRTDLVDAFCRAYPRLIEEAAGRLRAVFASGDYPPVEVIRQSFSLSWQYVNLGVPGSLQGVSRELFRKEQLKAQEQWEETLTEVRTLLRVQMQELVGRIAERLTGTGPDGKPRIFRDSMVSNLTDFLGVFDARNLSDDQELRQVVDLARRLITGVEPDTLRQSQTFRQIIGSGFTTLKEQLDGMMVDRPARLISFSDDE